MTVTATLVFFPDWSNVVAIGLLQGLAPEPLLVFTVAPTVMEAFAGMFAQAKFIQDATAPTRWPLAPIEVN